MAANDDVLITMRHVREAGMCSRGVRVFFEKHSLDWDEFLKNGIPASQVETIDDFMALEVVKVARNGRT